MQVQQHEVRGYFLTENSINLKNKSLLVGSEIETGSLWLEQRLWVSDVVEGSRSSTQAIIFKDCQRIWAW